jgi:glycosyltransferase involved in cell wall biosynthesis
METNFNEGDELIIVNDCSTDNTDQVLSSLKSTYPVIRIFSHNRNKGGAAARNTAVENTVHELIFCLDSDNVLEKNSIGLLKNFMLEQNADIACFQHLKYFNKTVSSVDEVWSFKLGDFTIKDLVRGELSPGASGNYLFTKNSWQKANGYTEDLGALDTWAFGFKQLIENCKMVVMPNGYYFHRRGHESYYLRDAWNKRKSVSLRLVKLIINYIDHIHPADVNYIFSPKGRYTWYDNLKKRPIRLIEKDKKEKVWNEHVLTTPFLQKVKSKLRYYKSRIF